MIKNHTLLASLALLLAACGGGGGGGGDTSAPTTTDASPPVTLGAPPPSTVNTNTNGSVLSRELAPNCALTQTLGPARNDGLRIAQASVLQIIEQIPTPNTTTRLAGGQPALIKVDVVANARRAVPTRAQALLHNVQTGACVPLTLVSTPPRIETSIPSPQQVLDNSYLWALPEGVMQPGARILVAFDQSTGSSLAEANNTLTVLSPVVTPPIVEQVTVIPLRFNGTTALTPTAADLRLLLRRYLPVGDFSVRIAEPFTPPTLNDSGLLSGVLNQLLLPDMVQVLTEVDEQCERLHPNQFNPRTATKCIGLFPDASLNFVLDLNSGRNQQFVGLAFVGGRTLIGRDFVNVDLSSSSPYNNGHWINFDAVTVAHEFGHLYTLGHGNCGGPSGLDPDLNESAVIGTPGYDLIRGFYFAPFSGFRDTMSYCSKEWTSNRGYNKMLNYRAELTAAAVAPSVSKRTWVMVSRQRDGRWRLSRRASPPVQLRPSDQVLTLTLNGETQQFPLQSVVIEEVTDPNLGPFYVGLDEDWAIDLPEVLSLPQQAIQLLRRR